MTVIRGYRCYRAQEGSLSLASRRSVYFAEAERDGLGWGWFSGQDLDERKRISGEAFSPDIATVENRMREVT